MEFLNLLRVEKVENEKVELQIDEFLKFAIVFVLLNVSNLTFFMLNFFDHL